MSEESLKHNHGGRSGRLAARLNLFDVDILNDLPVQGEGGFTDLQDVGRIFLVHPDQASGMIPRVLSRSSL